MCGREDGSVVIISAAKAAIAQLLQLPGSGSVFKCQAYSFLSLICTLLRVCILSLFYCYCDKCCLSQFDLREVASLSEQFSGLDLWTSLNPFISLILHVGT